MTRTLSIRSRWLLLLVAPLLGPAGTLHAGDPDRTSGRVTRYDIATRDDLLLAHPVAPSVVGDVQQWSRQLLGGLAGQGGDWASLFIGVTVMAPIITQAFPVEGQPALGSVDEVVADCDHTPGVDKPEVRSAPAIACTRSCSTASKWHRRIMAP